MAHLHSRIYLHSLGVLVVVCLITAIVFAVGAGGPFMREVAERVVRHVASLVAEDFGDPARLTRRLEQLRADLGVDLTVRDRAGRVVAAVGAELPPPRHLARLLAGGREIRGRPPSSAVAPLRDPDSGAIVGILQASARHRFGFLALWRPVLALALVLVVVAVVTRPIARRISRPIERLTAAARRLGGGDLSSRAPMPSARRGPGDPRGEPVSGWS